MKSPLLILSYLLPLAFMPADIAAQVVYANTQTNAKNGSCSTCSVTNPANAVSADTTDYSVINLTVQTAGGQVWQQLKFPSATGAGVYVYVIVEHTAQQPLTVANLSGLRLTSYCNNFSNLDTKQSNTYSISSWGPTKYLIGYTPASTFDAIDVRMIVQNPANPLSSIRVYAAFTSIDPLPVELLYFNASPLNNSVMLEWATATETGNDHFSVEKSADGVGFSVAGYVDGAGTSAFTTMYSYEDKDVKDGIWYYRLKQTDHDGNYSYSGIVAAQFREAKNNLDVYPNPCTGQAFYIDIMDGDADVEVLSLAGEKVYAQRVEAKGSNLVNLPRDLREGMYFVMVTSGSRMSMKRLMVK